MFPLGPTPRSAFGTAKQQAVAALEVGCLAAPCRRRLRQVLGARAPCLDKKGGPGHGPGLGETAGQGRGSGRRERKLWEEGQRPGTEESPGPPVHGLGVDLGAMWQRTVCACIRRHPCAAW